jgi:hypothetical protein
MGNGVADLIDQMPSANRRAVRRLKAALGAGVISIGIFIGGPVAAVVNSALTVPHR